MNAHGVINDIGSVNSYDMTLLAGTLPQGFTQPNVLILSLLSDIYLKRNLEKNILKQHKLTFLQLGRDGDF